MDLQFVIALSEHRILGYLFAPYLIKFGRKEGKHTIFERVTLLNLKTYENAITPEQVQLVKYIEEYNDQNLNKLFSKKKKLATKDFIGGMDKELFAVHIRPYIERRMARCLDIMLFNPVPIYHKALHSIIYEDDRIELIEEEGSAVFNFRRKEDGLIYYLSIEHRGEILNLKGSEGMVIINEPCCTILRDRLFVFRDIDGKKLMPFFDKDAISIPKASEKKYFESFVRNAIKKFKVNAEGFSIIDVDAEPVPTLSIENDLSGRYHFVLKFIYDEKSIYYANRKTDQKVSCEITDEQATFYRLKRDYNKENEFILHLLSLGLVNREGPFFIPMLKKDDSVSYEVINWINTHHRLLQKSGFSVAQNNLEKDYYLDDFEIRMEVSDKSNDWFDIEARVEFDGFKIPFASFRDNILNGEREYMLPNGKLVILPAEWFESYRDMMTFSRTEKDTMRLDKRYFSLLNKNIKGIPGAYKEKFLSLIETENAPEKVPGEVLAELRKYQVEGYSWLYRLHKNGFGGCLADDMGLGKTLQTITNLYRVISENRIEESQTSPIPERLQLSLFDSPATLPGKPVKVSLVVVPTSLVHNWQNEIRRFTPGLQIGSYVGGQRRPLQELVGQSDIILTSYGIIRNDIEEFSRFDFQYLILDESQMIKNPGSKTYQAVITLRADHRLVLTGTPIENSLSDLWAQINFLNPGLLGNLSFFRTQFQLPIEKNADENKRDMLLKLIAPFVLRRTKAEVEPELPPVSEQLIYCDMDDSQEVLYEQEKSRARNLVIEKLSQVGFQKSAMVILQSLTKLRQIANHPALVEENYFAGSGKYDEITRNLMNLLEEGHKGLIFSSFVKHLDLVAEFLDRKGVGYALLTGETRNREKEIDRFQKDDNCPFFLISLKAGGVGLNLTAADYVFILDPWWNPAAEMQAVSRAHRIGQEKNVFVYRFISRGTLEEKILKLQEKKAELAETFVNNNLKGISEEQVMDLFE
ncbi:MAG: DEAD/DEAH box helicase [Bacteroidales bacterium]|nr:DEAD/DEAH box helicase [Bacteroidales bacterium]